ncbi:MAG: hypothetical protein LAP61_16375 [Acidobacteriia bacterium]|nr:hypothetical protein [Terriglobia bacterium]
MKFSGILILFAALILNATASDLTGAWKVVFVGDPRTGPKTVGSIILDLKVDGNLVTGKVRIGSWPGEAPIEDGRVEDGHITFTATGHLDSTTGIPTCKFDVLTQEDGMRVTMTAIKNGGGPLALGRDHHYIGNRIPDYSSAKLTPMPNTF